MTGSVVLVLGDYLQTLTVARSLSRRGDRVIADMTKPRSSYVRRSRYVDELWTHCGVGDPRFDEMFAEAISRYHPDLVFPVGDLEIAWAASVADEWQVPFAIPDPAVALTCQDKSALLERAAEVDVPVCSSQVVEGSGSLRAAASRMGWPCIVKSNDPLQRVFGTKGVICHSAREFEETFASWPEGHESLIVQQYVAGPRHNLYFAAAEGEIIGCTEVRIIRTDALAGTGNGVDGITVEPRADVVGHTRALVRDLKYHGVGCTQFLLDPSGGTTILELNPRLGAKFVVVTKAGLDLATAAADLALGRPVHFDGTVRHGVRYAWTTGDLAGLVEAMHRDRIGIRVALRWLAQAVRTSVTADVHATWSLFDPLPSLSAMSEAVARPVAARLLRDPLAARRRAQSGADQ